MKVFYKNTVSRMFILTASCLVIMSGLVSAQERVSVDANVANIRSGAGTKTNVLWQVERFHPFIVVEKKGKWVKVKDFENDQAWIHSSLLGKTKSVITIKNKCNVRSKPTTKSSILFTTERGVPFRSIKKEGNWLKVEHADGDVGWIHKSLVW